MHRRHLITAVPALCLVAASPAQAVIRRPSVDELVAQLVEALQLESGAQWVFKYDHELLMMQRVSQTA